MVIITFITTVKKYFKTNVFVYIITVNYTLLACVLRDFIITVQIPQRRIPSHDNETIY